MAYKLYTTVYIRDQMLTPHPTDFIVDLTNWTFKNNIFLFQDQLYKQVKGTAMVQLMPQTKPSYTWDFQKKGMCTARPTHSKTTSSGMGGNVYRLPLFHLFRV